ncbi:MAG: hypothetical protein AAFU60_11875 [Bacteroidota bacterium]
MNEKVAGIYSGLINLLKEQLGSLRIVKENPNVFEVGGTKEVMQGKQKVDGHYFASIVPKPKDVRLYFFPIYTHPEEYSDISPDFRKFLKGKSCFHIKRLDAEMEAEIRRAIQKGVELYQRDGLI